MSYRHYRHYVQVATNALTVAAVSASLAWSSAGAAEGGAASGHHDNLWIGVVAVPISPALRAHLDVPEGMGLVIEDVVPGSPAATAGLKLHDVVFRAGDRAIASIEELRAAVIGSKGSQMTIELLRAGKRRKLVVTPGKRPRTQFLPPVVAGSEDDHRLLQHWLRDDVIPEIRSLEPRTFGLRWIGPAFEALPSRRFPDDLTLSITKEGSAPARIEVRRGGDTWSVSEEEIDKLPADLQPFVKRFFGSPGRIEWKRDSVPWSFFERAQPKIGGSSDEATRSVKERIDALEGQVERLLDELREIRGEIREDDPGSQPPADDEPEKA